MGEIELAKEILGNRVESKSFPCIYNASIDCWSMEGVIFFSKNELMYLISERVGMPNLFSAFEMTALNLEEKLRKEAYEAAFPDGDDDIQNVDCWCICESIDNYIDSWEIVINRILNGDISGSCIEDWMSYFSSAAMAWETIEEYMS